MSLADDIIRAAQAGAEDALHTAALLVAEAAKRNMPVGDPEVDPDQEVALRESIRIEPSLRGGWFVIVDTPYAARQEFNLRLRHPRGGGARFLHRALLEVAPRLQGITAGKVDAETATGRISDSGRSHRRRSA